MRKKNIAEKYIDDIISDKIPHNEFVHLAVERHQRDLVDGIDRGLYFDRKSAERALKFYSFLRHGKMKKFAGKPFEPAPWQAFIDWVVYGWKNANGYRRFNLAYIQVPRKNGKTVKISKDGLYLAFAENEIGAEVYAAANKEDQARIALGEAWNIVKNSDSLHYTDIKNKIERLENFGGKTSIRKIKSIVEPSTGNFFQSIGRDLGTQDGLNVKGAILDEYHEAVDDDLMNVLTSATGAQDEWLMWIITTAGFNLNGPCYNEREVCIKILKGILVQDNKFAFIAEPDEGDNWEDQSVWEKVNPNWGISVNPDEVKKAYIDAKNKPTKINNFKTKYLNIWCSSQIQWIKDEDWQKCNHGLVLDDIWGRECYAGLDLASHVDLNALALFFPDKQPYDIWVFFWCPEEKIKERNDHVDYQYWSDLGWIKGTPGNITDIDMLTSDILHILSKVKCKGLAFDRYRAFDGVIQNLKKEIPDPEDEFFSEFGQGFISMSLPTKKLEALALSKNLNNGGNPVLRWMNSNVYIVSDSAENIKIDKKKSADKVDGMVAAVMAIGEWLTPDDDDDFQDFLNNRLNNNKNYF